ncbi:carboxymuconolactone decarboxylase family protein [Lentzea sp. NPDC058436]|uniref:carboxymuconolactone decarboxylase family protein n=1 Tax=Lentzea sp. NPDC058436 TaxID=3346499 RepID=UPI00365FD2C7
MSNEDEVLNERRERGIAVYAETFGVGASEVQGLFADRVGSLFAEEAVLAAGGPAWNDPSLDERSRSIVILTALICEGVRGNRLTTHLERAVRAGVDQPALEVLTVLLALYVGQARTALAAEEMRLFFTGRHENS